MSEWKPIPSVPGYFANLEGRIRGKRGWILRPQLVKGYLAVTPRINGATRTIAVHKLICEAFHGPRPRWAECIAHNNGVKTDNRADNLRYATWKENEADKESHGTRLRGERHQNSLLSSQQISEIRAQYRNGMNWCGVKVSPGLRKNLALKFNVGVHVISYAVKRRKWLLP